MELIEPTYDLSQEGSSGSYLVFSGALVCATPPRISMSIALRVDARFIGLFSVTELEEEQRVAQ